MEREPSPRRALYVDPELQFPLILGLIVLVTAEGLFVGWGAAEAVAAARDWRRPDHAARAFLLLLGVVVPVVAANFLAGAWLTNRVAGPLRRIREALREVARGNLEARVATRAGDLLGAHVLEANRMIETLRRLLYRDRGHALEADAILARCRARLEAPGLPAELRAELGRELDEARSRLSVINHHFMKGRAEGA